jgi:chromate transport protein ChrA
MIDQDARAFLSAYLAWLRSKSRAILSYGIFVFLVVASFLMALNYHISWAIFLLAWAGIFLLVERTERRGRRRYITYKFKRPGPKRQKTQQAPE